MVQTEAQKAYNRAYHEKNKEGLTAYNKAYREKNKEKELARHREYREQNKERLMAYNQTPARKKSQTKAKWKSRGLNMENFEYIYQRYLDTSICDNCEIELDQCNRSRKCMDHSHDTGDFRNILCHCCNTRRR